MGWALHAMAQDPHAAAAPARPAQRALPTLWFRTPGLQTQKGQISVLLSSHVGQFVWPPVWGPHSYQKRLQNLSCFPTETIMFEQTLWPQHERHFGWEGSAGGRPGHSGTLVGPGLHPPDARRSPDSDNLKATCPLGGKLCKFMKPV